MAAASSVTIAPKVNRPMSHQDFGREEYIDNCVQRVLKGENVLILFWGYVPGTSLPEILQQKYGSGPCVVFPGFSLAKNDIVNNVQALGKKVLVTEYRNGANSDLLGLLGNDAMNLDGYYIQLAPEPTKAAVPSSKDSKEG
jgi:hypothetical protein